MRRVRSTVGYDAPNDAWGHRLTSGSANVTERRVFPEASSYVSLPWLPSGYVTPRASRPCRCPSTAIHTPSKTCSRRSTRPRTSCHRASPVRPPKIRKKSRLNDINCVVKTGYPPRPLTLVPELPIASLDLKSGEQLIVQETALGSSRGSESNAARSPPPRAAPSSPKRREQPSQAAPLAAAIRKPTQPRAPSPKRKSGKEVESIEVDGGWLIHRVCLRLPR